MQTVGPSVLLNFFHDQSETRAIFTNELSVYSYGAIVSSYMYMPPCSLHWASWCVSLSKVLA